MLVRNQSPRLTATQYLELEQISDVNHKYLAEDVYAIASNLKYQILAGNIYVYLQLKLLDVYKVYANTSAFFDRLCDFIVLMFLSVQFQYMVTALKLLRF